MYKVFKTAGSPNIVWDSANQRPLCRFKGGIFETEDVEVATELKKLGYEVENPKEEPVENPKEEPVENPKGTRNAGAKKG